MARFAKVKRTAGPEIEINIDMIAYVENLDGEKSRVHFGPAFAVETTRPAKFFKKFQVSQDAPSLAPVARRELGAGPARERLGFKR